MIDIVIVGTLLISVLIGWVRGAVKEVCSVISWFGSGYLAYRLFPTGLEIVRDFVEQPILANIITGVSLFVIFLIVLSLLTYIFSKIVNESIFSRVDKICGVLFGLVRGILILSVAEFGSTYYIFKEPPEFVTQSTLLPYIKNTAQMMFLLLPEKIQRELMNYSSPEKQQELVKALGGKLKETVIAIKKDDNSVLNNNSNNSNSQNQNANKSQDNTGNSQSDNDATENHESQSAKELAHLGVKKTALNPNLSKSVRSDLDKFIEQNTD